MADPVGGFYEFCLRIQDEIQKSLFVLDSGGLLNNYDMADLDTKNLKTFLKSVPQRCTLSKKA